MPIQKSPVEGISEDGSVMAETQHPMIGKLVLITGATSGIGEAAARELAARGAAIVVVARDRHRGEQTLARIRAATGNEQPELLVGDLAVQGDARRVAGEFRERHDRLDVLINNAGGVFGSRRLTADGLELTFALDHLAYFLLTHELLDVLKASAPSRIVSTSSDASARGSIDFDDLQLERGYRPFRAYANAKLANILFTFELARRLEGSGVTANCLHPGFVRTGFGAGLGAPLRLGTRAAQLFARRPEKGAETLVYLASSPAVAGMTGTYFFDKQPKTPPAAAVDLVLARRLWAVSEQLTGGGDPAAGAAGTSR
jgi:NAD(P)-dependent dehydrogenase (short-subunit alcohol dehydrogenase family)